MPRHSPHMPVSIQTSAQADGSHADVRWFNEVSLRHHFGCVAPYGILDIRRVGERIMKFSWVAVVVFAWFFL